MHIFDPKSLGIKTRVLLARVYDKKCPKKFKNPNLNEKIAIDLRVQG